MATQRSVVMLTTGVPGSGKSYARVRFIATEFLAEEKGLLITNLPLEESALAAYVAKATKQDEAAIRSRIMVIPVDVERSWREGVPDAYGNTDDRLPASGPWDFLANVPLQGAHIVLDEAHTFISQAHEINHRRRWKQFCGELRHRGATIEFMTQDSSNLSEEVRADAGLWLSMTNSETRRDPYFKVPLYDWYQVAAKFVLGRMIARVWQMERRKVDGKWVEEEERSWLMLPAIFALYDSYSRPKGSEETEHKAEAKVQPYQRLGRLQLVAWFLKRNWVRVTPKAAIASVVIWLTLFGGGVHLLGAVMRGLEQKASNAMGSGKVAESKKKPQGREAAGRIAPVADPLFSPGVRTVGGADRRRAPAKRGCGCRARRLAREARERERNRVANPVHVRDAERFLLPAGGSDRGWHASGQAREVH